MKKVPLIHIIIATGFGSGFSPFAPGTAGALLATLIWLALSCTVSPIWLLIITALLIIVFTIAGVYSANAVEPIWGKDPSRVVVDEMVGVWIPLFGWQLNPMFGAAAMLDGLLDRMEQELGTPATVVATGGISKFVVPLCRRKLIYDRTLMLKGLNLLYQRNVRA